MALKNPLGCDFYAVNFYKHRNLQKYKEIIAQYRLLDVITNVLSYFHIKIQPNCDVHQLINVITQSPNLFFDN